VSDRRRIETAERHRDLLARLGDVL